MRAPAEFGAPLGAILEADFSREGVRVAHELIFDMTSDGQVCLQLRQRWADGTTQLVFDPVEFLGRLAVLVPRPRINLVLYHGVLGPRAAWRMFHDEFLSHGGPPIPMLRQQLLGAGGTLL